MPVGVGYGPNSSSVAPQADQQLIQQQNQNRDNQVQRTEAQEQRVVDLQTAKGVQEQEALRSEAGRQEQTQRERDLRSDVQPVQSQQLQAPNAETIRELEATATERRQQIQGASGLGQTAVNSYSQLQANETATNLSEKIKVDITA